MPAKAAKSFTYADRADGLHASIRDHIHRYPYLAVALGAGLGYAAAGGLRPGPLRRVLGAIGGVALFSPIWSQLFFTGLSIVQPRRFSNRSNS